VIKEPQNPIGIKRLLRVKIKKDEKIEKAPR
jgi:hypothetical protein